MRIVPETVRRLIEEPSTQRGIVWPRAAWVACIPDKAPLFEGLPDALDRASVRTACADAGEDLEGTEAAFLATMAWGYGRVG